MEFEVGQWVKFKNYEEYMGILNVASTKFAQRVDFNDTFKVIKNNHPDHVFIEKDGFTFWCRKGRLVPIIHILEGAEEL